MKYFTIFIGILSILWFLPFTILAFCPVCVVATGLFAGFFRWLGVDDTIVGLWLGGFIFSLSIMLNNYLVKKIKTSKALILAMVLAVSYGLTISALALGGFFYPHNKIFGIYKIIFGIAFGTLLIFLAPFLDKFLREQNKDKMFISHQKVLVAVVLLFIFSLIFYFLLK